MAKRRRIAARERRNHMPVLDASGERVGWVAADGLGDDYITIESGLLFPNDVSVPRSWVETIATDRVTLSKTRQDVEHERELRDRHSFRNGH